MGKIKIEDLPEDQKISDEEMRKVFGGVVARASTPQTQFTTTPLSYVKPQIYDPGLIGGFADTYW